MGDIRSQLSSIQLADNKLSKKKNLLGDPIYPLALPSDIFMRRVPREFAALHSAGASSYPASPKQNIELLAVIACESSKSGMVHGASRYKPVQLEVHAIDGPCGSVESLILGEG